MRRHRTASAHIFQWRMTMNTRRMMMVAVMTMLIIAPGFALAQGPGRQMGMRGGMGPDSGSMMQMQGMMQQMGGTMQHMAERIQAGPMTPEQTHQMGEMRGERDEKTNNRSRAMKDGRERG